MEQTEDLLNTTENREYYKLSVNKYILNWFKNVYCKGQLYKKGTLTDNLRATREKACLPGKAKSCS